LRVNNTTDEIAHHSDQFITKQKHNVDFNSAKIIMSHSNKFKLKISEADSKSSYKSSGSRRKNTPSCGTELNLHQQT
jgi:hypothetical protein